MAIRIGHASISEKGTIRGAAGDQNGREVFIRSWYRHSKGWITLRCKVPASADQLRYGMRGVARISGGKVSLGYRLFKSAVLYFRGL